MLRVITSLASLCAFSLTLVVATTGVGPPAFAKEGTPPVATRSYKVCGSWKNKLLSPYGVYAISNYNDFVPPGAPVNGLQEMPSAVWQFFFDGVSRGYAYNPAFLAILDIYDQAGASRPQTIYGSYKQKFRQLTLEIDTTPPAEASFNSASVNRFNEQITTTAPNSFINNSGPFRFRTGALPGNVLPAPLTQTTSYYIKRISATVLQVSLAPGGVAVNLTSNGSGIHMIYPFGDPIANSYAYLSQLFLLGGLDTMSVVTPITLEKLKLKLKLNREATQLGVKLVARTNYDIVTEDLDAQGARGNLRYAASSDDCIVP